MDKAKEDLGPESLLKMRTLIGIVGFVLTGSMAVSKIASDANSRMTTLEERMNYGREQREQLQAIVIEMRGDVKNLSRESAEMNATLKQIQHQLDR